jgi:hypothetical protein
MPTSPIVIALTVLTLGICVFALWKGGQAERFGAGLILANAVLSTAGDLLFPHSDLAVVWLVGDGLTAVGLLVVAIVYASFWLGGVMLLYAILFTLHSFYFVTGREVDLFHARVNNADFLGISVCLAIGTIIAWRKRVVARRKAAKAEELALQKT